MEEEELYEAYRRFEERARKRTVVQMEVHLDDGLPTQARELSATPSEEGDSA